MSFNNTKTPLKPTRKPRYPIPMVDGPHGTKMYQLEGELLERFIRYFPKHTNREMMTLFGISFSTLQKLKRKYNLQHHMKTIIKKQAKMCVKICEENGYYDSLRGKTPCQEAMDKTKQMWEDGFHPMKALREKNYHRWYYVRKKNSKKRKELMSKERRRVDLGIPTLTNLYMPFDIFTKQQLSIRMNMKRRGYLVGYGRDNQERMNIYYNSETIRSEKVEQHALAMHFNLIAI